MLANVTSGNSRHPTRLQRLSGDYTALHRSHGRVQWLHPEPCHFVTTNRHDCSPKQRFRMRCSNVFSPRQKIYWEWNEAICGPVDSPHTKARLRCTLDCLSLTLKTEPGHCLDTLWMSSDTETDSSFAGMSIHANVKLACWSWRLACKRWNWLTRLPAGCKLSAMECCRTDANIRTDHLT